MSLYLVLNDWPTNKWAIRGSRAWPSYVLAYRRCGSWWKHYNSRHLVEVKHWGQFIESAGAEFIPPRCRLFTLDALLIPVPDTLYNFPPTDSHPMQVSSFTYNKKYVLWNKVSVPLQHFTQDCLSRNRLPVDEHRLRNWCDALRYVNVMTSWLHRYGCQWR